MKIFMWDCVKKATLAVFSFTLDLKKMTITWSVKNIYLLYYNDDDDDDVLVVIFSHAYECKKGLCSLSINRKTNDNNPN